MVGFLYKLCFVTLQGFLFLSLLDGVSFFLYDSSSLPPSPFPSLSFMAEDAGSGTGAGTEGTRTEEEGKSNERMFLYLERISGIAFFLGRWSPLKGGGKE